MDSQKVNIAVIGANIHAGWGGVVHIPALLELPEYRVVGLCTSRKETALEAAEHFGVPMAFHDYREMVAHPNVEAVSVCVRVPLHHEMVMAALEAGKHVYCEWPLGVTVAEAEEMAAKARERGVVHMVGLQLRNNPVLLRLKELIDEGYVGDMLSVRMKACVSSTPNVHPRLAWEVDGNLGAHVLSIPGGHTLDVISHCVAEFSQLSAQVSTQLTSRRVEGTGEVLEVTAPDTVLVAGTLTNGAAVSAHVSRGIWHGTGWTLEVYGTEGTLVASANTLPQLATSIRLEGARDSEEALAPLEIPKGLTWAPEGLTKVEPFNTAQMFRRFAAAIRNGGPVHPNFDDAVANHELLASIERSSALGRKVSVN